ncbi:MAG: OsmC family protein [Bacilli bacterium]
MAQTIKMEWEHGFNGTLIAPNGTFAIGNESGKLLPYNMLFGALGSCFYSTFLDIVEKKRLPLEGASIRIQGTHREELPFTLNHVIMDIVIKATGNEEKYLRSIELSKKYCSIFTTVSQVADIVVNVQFEAE